MAQADAQDTCFPLNLEEVSVVRDRRVARAHEFNVEQSTLAVIQNEDKLLYDHRNEIYSLRRGVGCLMAEIRSAVPVMPEIPTLARGTAFVVAYPTDLRVDDFGDKSSSPEAKRVVAIVVTARHNTRPRPTFGVSCRFSKCC